MAQPPKIKHNSRVAERLGQLPEEQLTKPAPTEVPDIVDRYMQLVGRVIQGLEQQKTFGSREANAVASIGRAVALLQALDTAQGSLGTGEKPLDQMTTEAIKARLGLTGKTASTVDAEFEESLDEK